MSEDALVRIGLAEDGRATASYELAGPVSELRFAADAPEVREAWWRVEPPFAMSGDRITAPEPFTAVTATLLPQDRWIDRVSASFVPLDAAAALVNLDYVRLSEEMPARITIANGYDSRSGECLASYDVTFAPSERKRSAAGRYVALGRDLDACARHFEELGDPPRFAGAAIPGVTDDLAEALRPLYESLERQLGATPEEAPLIFVSWDRTSPRDTYQADAGWRSVVSLRFYGPAWGMPAEERSVQVLGVLTHELVHLWIGRLVRPDDGEGLARAWLHEGAAEYLSLLALARHGHLSAADFRRELAPHLTGCTRDLGAAALLSEREPAGGRLVYDCGVLVQFVYDLAARAKSEGSLTIVDLWRGIVERSLASGARTFPSSAFIDAYPRAKTLLSGALYGPGIDPPALLEGLGALGVETALRDPDRVPPWAAAVIMPLLRADCGGGAIGFYTYAASLELDTNETCGTIPDGFVVRYIEDVDVISQPAAAYEAAVRSCEGGGSLRLSGITPGQPVLTLRCKKLAARPAEIEIRRIGFLEP